MCLGKYGIKIKKYLKEYYPIKYNQLIIDCTLIDYLYAKEKELLEYSASIEKQLKEIYPIPKTNEFLVIARYNNMIKSMVEEFINIEISNECSKIFMKMYDF